MENQPIDEMNYEKLVQDALRGAIPRALRKIQKNGPPGAHHFYITLKTKAPGVSLPGDVLAKYPDEMTIVLQHQFWALEVWEDRFDVQLKFGGIGKTLVVPYAAVTRFYDPAVQFLLQFDPPDAVEPKVDVTIRGPAEIIADESGDNVVSLFRKGPN